jgi:RNA polymerase II subunit A-like phosphatase
MKRRKVSFAPPAVTQEKFNQPPGSKSDHMTLEQLEELKKELEDAERLEAEAWDLRQRVFGSRVVSRTDVGDLGRDVKSLKRIFPCGGTMAAVVDDREDVWANASDNSDETVKGEPPENLLLVRPYHWQPFIGFADVNNAAGDDLAGGSTMQGADPDKETDTQLLWTGQILKELHTRYYAQMDESSRKTVPEVLSEMRREVLKGTKLVLSGLVPLHKKTVGTNAPRPPIIRYAQSMGAKLLDRVQPGVTHVVAAKDGTDKALAARRIPGCMLVKASWLVECFWSLTRRDVIPHLMDPGSAVVTQQLQMDTKMDNSSDGSADSEDDDLAAEFEDELMNML